MKDAMKLILRLRDENRRLRAENKRNAFLSKAYGRQAVDRIRLRRCLEQIGELVRDALADGQTPAVHVAPSGSDSAGTGSRTKPYRTIQRAMRGAK